MYQQELCLPALSSALDCCTDTRPSSHDTRMSEDSVTDTAITKEVKFNSQKKKPVTGKSSIKVVNQGVDVENKLKSPGLSYIALISMAIQSCASKKMLLSEIYSWISENYPYYQMKDKSWRNSIRHNLSLNECFVKSGRSENGKGNYWSIHPANIEDFSKGDYRRRRARRQVRKCDEDLKRLCSNSPDIVKPPSPTSAEKSCQNGYVPMASTLVPPNFLSAIGVDAGRSYNYMYADLIPESEDNKKPSMWPYSDKTDIHFSGSDAPYQGRCHGLESLTSSPTEPTVNVNVNVNLCGTTDTTRQDCYPYVDRLCTPLQAQHYGYYWQDSCSQPPYCS